jgi:hypothetical protein
VRLNGPGMSRDLPVPEAGDFALPALDRVGVYRTDPVVPQYERIVREPAGCERKQSGAARQAAGKLGSGRSGNRREITTGPVVVDRRVRRAAACC